MNSSRRADAERVLRQPDAVRCFLLFGPDEAGSRSLVKLFADSLGPDAERVALTGADLKGDPARLADEAASIAMFGGRRWILVDPAGEESVAAVEALLEAGAAGNPVLLVAGDLKPTSRLRKLVAAAPDGWALASYLPDSRDAARLVAELGRSHGLIVAADLAHRIAEASAGNRAVIEQELAKLTLYLDASPAAPVAVDHDALDAVGAHADEGDLSRLVDSVLDGDARTLDAEIARLRAEGQEGITLVRALLRRLMVIARLRAQVERGRRPADVMAAEGKSLFWKEKDAVTRQLARWPAERLAKAVSRLTEAEGQVMTPGGPGAIAVDDELFAIARQAARLR